MKQAGALIRQKGQLKEGQSEILGLNQQENDSKPSKNMENVQPVVGFFLSPKNML